MKYRKKPVVIEAVQWIGEVLGNDAPEWLRTAIRQGQVYVVHEPKGIVVHTLEGKMEGQPGDFIIQGIKGELYPCKPDIFAATYEEAE